MTSITVGQRVRVTIPDSKKEGWNAGAYQSLQGSTGTVERVFREGHMKDGAWRVLVRFDEPVKAWHAYALPHEAFHFDPDELTVF